MKSNTLKINRKTFRKTVILLIEYGVKYAPIKILILTALKEKTPFVFMSEIIDRRKLAIHECCHAVMNRLFSDYLKLNDISLAPEGSTGQLGSNFIQGLRFDTINTYSATGIVWLAGIVGDTITDKGVEEVKTQKELYLNKPELLDWNFGGGDRPGFHTNASFLSGNKNVDPVKYQKFCLEYLIDFLTDKHVREYVERLAKLLLSKADNRLLEQELVDFFESSGFDQFLATKKAELIERLGRMGDECKKDDPFANYDFAEYPLP